MKREICFFAQLEFLFLGHVIKDGKLLTDERKLLVIRVYKPLTKVPELYSFLGLINYY